MGKPKESDAAPMESASMFSEIAGFFTSVRTTIGVLFFLAAASVIGTVVPQEMTPDRLPAADSLFLQRLIAILDLNSVFRSWWFILLLMILALNLLGCLISRLPAIFTEWRGAHRRNSFSATFSDSRSEDELRPLVTKELSSLICRAPVEVEIRGGRALSWTRDKINLLGFPCIHAAIIIVLLGGLGGLMYGVKGHVQIREGGIADSFRLSPSGQIRKLPFSIAVDKFTLERYPTGEPKEFRSDVRLLKEGKEALKAGIRVNHPLTYDGFSLYQSDYRLADVKDVTVGVKKPDGKDVELVIPARSVAELEGVGHKFRVLSLDPGTPLRGAGVELQADPPQGQSVTVTMFKKDPEPAQIGDLKVRFIDYSPLYSTGLQVGRDPGAPVVWAGCLLLVLGFLLTLFTNHRGATVEFQKSEKGTTIKVSGRSKRMRKEFREQVENRIRTALSGNINDKH